MKNKTRIFYGNQHIESFRCTGSKTIKKPSLYYRFMNFMAVPAIVYGVICAIFSAYQIGGMVNSTHIVEANEIIRLQERDIPPVMKRIAKCESEDSHINPKTGTVYMLANTNKTVDVGRYMINTVWHKKAQELGYDVTKEEDNTKMAMYIYENFGTSPWKYSAHCWDK